MRGTYLEQEEPASWEMSRLLADSGFPVVPKGFAKRRSRSEQPDEFQKMSACCLITTTSLRHTKWRPSPPFPALFPTDVLIEFSETRSQSLCATMQWTECAGSSALTQLVSQEKPQH
jgi:hypothetical protein